MSKEQDIERAIELLRVARAMLVDAWVGMISYTEAQVLEKHALKEGEFLVGEGLDKVVEALGHHKEEK